MVRNIVGTLVEVGLQDGYVKETGLQAIIDRRSRHDNPASTAPAQGLFLIDVHYDTQEMNRYIK